jgi:hypothetical protein
VLQAVQVTTTTSLICSVVGWSSYKANEGKGGLETVSYLEAQINNEEKNESTGTISFSFYEK